MKRTVAISLVSFGLASCGPSPVPPPPLVQLSPVERLDPASVEAPPESAVAAYVGCYRLAIPAVPAQGEGARWIQREKHIVAQLQSSPGPSPSQMRIRYTPSVGNQHTWSLRAFEAWFSWSDGYSGIQFRLDRRGGNLRASARYSSCTELLREWEVVDVERVACDG